MNAILMENSDVLKSSKSIRTRTEKNLLTDLL